MLSFAETSETQNSHELVQMAAEAHMELMDQVIILMKTFCLQAEIFIPMSFKLISRRICIEHAMRRFTSTDGDALSINHEVFL